jgi:hypothetical protein
MRSEAVAALATRDYDAAGEAYTRAAWRTLSAPGDGRDPFETDERGRVGRGLQYLVVAVLCYRVAGRDDRATRRGVEGVAVTRDLADAVAVGPQEGCFGEFVADCKLVGGLDGHEAAYEAAENAYRGAADGIEDPRKWATTPLFEAAKAPLQQAARSLDNGEIGVTWEDCHGDDPSSPGAFLAHRARFKRNRFPSLVDRVVANGYLATPRGTTEYSTDHHRCPECGSTDVNWVADNVVCLRCSAPSAPQ